MSWQDRPKFITDDTIETLGIQIRTQSEKYNLEKFVVELHGGEPLLYGKRKLVRLVERLRELASPCRLEFLLQTNGLLLDNEWLEIFRDNEIRAGISIDGPPVIADKFRVDHTGNGSTQKLLDNIACLRNESSLFDDLRIGYLCVMNPDIDGRELVNWFIDQNISSFDLLWPHGNYVNYPDHWEGCGAYTNLLIDAFDRWYELDDAAPRIRLFEVMMLGLMGIKPKLDALGGDLRNLCVIESNGAIGISDVVRFLGGSFNVDSLNIFTHQLDEHVDFYSLEEIQKPCSTCLSCEFLTACGGGYLQDRFDGSSFANPSIYCETLFNLLTHIKGKLAEQLPLEVWQQRKTFKT